MRESTNKDLPVRKEDVAVYPERIYVQSAHDGLLLEWPSNVMFEVDPYSAFVDAFENAYHGARAFAESLSQKEYEIIMALAEKLIQEDPATDEILDTSSM